MALDSTIQGGSSVANKANVDASYNLQVNTPTNSALAGFTALTCVNDAGAITGNKETKSPRCSDDFRLSIGVDTPLFEDSFNGLQQNTNIWKFFSLNSLVASQSGGYLNLNPTQVITSGGTVSMQSYRYITLMGNATIHIEFFMSFSGVSITPLAGQILEFGLFAAPATAVAPPDGVFFRYTSNGLQGVTVNNSGGENTIATPRACSNFTLDANYSCKMIIGEKFVDFYVNNVEIGSINTPSGFGAPFLSQALPISMLCRNTGTIASVNGSYLRISDIHVDALDLEYGKSNPQILAGMGRHGSVSQNGAVIANTAAVGNSTVIGTAAALSNTAIAAPACVGLGGVSTYLPTLTVFQDGILSSYQNPAGTVNIQGRTLFITGVRISSAVSAAFTGGAVAQLYYLAYGHTAVGLTTAEASSFTTGGGKSPRRVPLGGEGFPITAALGTFASGGVSASFTSPIVVNPGEFVAVVAKNVGIVTTAGSITSMISFDSYWE